jgi:hypothetical protein
MEINHLRDKGSVLFKEERQRRVNELLSLVNLRGFTREYEQDTKRNRTRHAANPYVRLREY